MRPAGYSNDAAFAMPLPNNGEAEASRPHVSWLAPRVTHLDIALFATQMRAMIGAGLPINEVLGLLARSSRAGSPRLAHALEAIRDDVEQGRSLADAFRQHEGVFGRLCVEMIATGETTGTLESTLGDIAEDSEHRHRNRASLLSAFVEPILIVVVGLAVSYLLLTVTVPQFKTLYATLTKSAALPVATQLLIAVSDVLSSPLGIAVLVALVLGGTVAAMAVARNEVLRYWFDRALLRVPVLGELVLLDAIARAARTIGVVYRSVGEIPLGIELATATTSNRRVSEAFVGIGADVYEGRMLWEAMRDAAIVPELCVSMTKSGEETGRLDTMLFKLSETLETRVRYRKERLLTLLRYGLLLLTGGLVLGLMLALYLPIFSLIEHLRR
jgi:type IV pilus assembly protein PilC